MATIESVKTAISTTETKKITTVFEYFEHRKKDIEAVLPKHLTADRLIGIMTYCIKGNPKIAACSQPSLIAAVIQSVQLGLEPNVLGQCYFIPYNNKQSDGTKKLEVQFQIGYRGLLELVRRSGQISTISAEAVYEKDYFLFEYGLEDKLVHRPTLEDRGKPRAYYAVAKFKDGGYAFHVMSVSDVEKIRARSKAGDDGPWRTDYDAMAKKTVLKQLCKYLPLSIDKVLMADETTKREISPDIASEQIDVTNWEQEDTAIPEMIQPPEEKHSPAQEKPKQAKAEKAVSATATAEIEKGIAFVMSEIPKFTIGDLKVMVSHITNGKTFEQKDMSTNELMSLLVALQQERDQQVRDAETK